MQTRLHAYRFNVLVSEKEGFPNAVVEAAAIAMPSLVTGVDGSRDTLPGRLALPNAVPCGEPARLAEALAAWFRSPDLVDADGRKFYEFLKPLCSPEIVAEQYTRLYATMIGESLA